MNKRSLLTRAASFLPFLKRAATGIDRPLALAAIMALAGLVCEHPVTVLCLITAVAACVFFLARMADPLFQGRTRAMVLTWWVACLTALFTLGVPVAVILILPVCGLYSRRAHKAAALPADFISAIGADRAYRLIIMAMLLLVMIAGIYGFRVTPHVMASQSIEISSFSRVKI